MSVSSVSNNLAMLEEENPFKPVGKSQLDQYDFMNLFITQLQHQDPMKPMDSYEMASQLAQFSNMEATLKMSNNMEELLAYQTSQNNLQLLTLLDNEVQVGGNVIGVNEGVASAGDFTIFEEVDTCVVEIYDAGGHLIDIMDMGKSNAGTYALEWDGNDMQGEPVPDGAYSFRVKGYTATGSQADVEYRVQGTVTGINYESGTALLTLDNFVAADVGSVLSVL